MLKKFAKKFSSVRMQLVASVFVAIAPVLVLTYLVNRPWFWRFAPEWLKPFATDVPWAGFTIGLVALIAAWFGGEHFILRQVQALSDAAKRLAAGDLSSRTGLHENRGELGQLAETFDAMAAVLQQRVRDLEQAKAEVQKLAAFAQLNPNPAMEFADDGALIYSNAATLALAGSVGKKHAREILPPEILAVVRDCRASGRSHSLETKLGERTLAWSFHPMPGGNVVHGYAEDITGRLNLEAQLRQSQKMESVGQLAAGVAHDFNNMLTIIEGHSSSLLARQNLPPEIRETIQAVFAAAERAAGLTRQLMMFSRKNVMQIKPLDLRETIGQMTKMLQLLIGENVALEFQPPRELPWIAADRGMIEQVLMNLSTNARDAMPHGGRLVIAVEAVRFEETGLAAHPEARPGEFVRLQVRDTGVGMNPATQEHIFEPFFTTKQIGKGTGLGLATVYGIVKQHDGWLEVASEPNHGTSFDLFFPASKMTGAPGVEKNFAVRPAAGGNETIFIVEDEPLLREMARTILEKCGYRILEASSGRDALEVWRRHTEQIDLLLTDMVMPDGVSGAELAGRLLVQKPDLKILFTSGYAAGEISAEVLEKTRARFLQKPFSETTLTQAVRDTLDKKTGNGGAWI